MYRKRGSVGRGTTGLDGWWTVPARDATDRLAMLVCRVLVRSCSLGRRGAALGAVARLTPVHSCLQWRARSPPGIGQFPAEWHTNLRLHYDAKTRHIVPVGFQTQSSGHDGVLADR